MSGLASESGFYSNDALAEELLDWWWASREAVESNGIASNISELASRMSNLS